MFIGVGSRGNERREIEDSEILTLGFPLEVYILIPRKIYLLLDFVLSIKPIWQLN